MHGFYRGKAILRLLLQIQGKDVNWLEVSLCHIVAELEVSKPELLDNHALNLELA